MPSAYSPASQLATHEPLANGTCWKKGASPAHAVHDDVLAPSHSWQLASHGPHRLRPPSTSANVPFEGQAALHTLPSRKGFGPPGVQLRHCSGEGPLHVAQRGEHAAHVGGLRPTGGSPHLPYGVQSATHAPVPSAQSRPYGELGAHVRQSVAIGPAHVAHDDAHGTHTSFAVALPP